MFELTIPKQSLLNALLTVAGAIDKKQSLAILSNILLKLTDTHLFLTATDLEIQISASIPFTTSQHQGSVTVPAKKMIDIIRSLDDHAEPMINCSNGVVTIKQGRSKFKLSTLPADNYPNSEDEFHDIEFNVLRHDLIRLFQSTHFAMSQQDVRIFLNGLLLEMESNLISAVATDGHRMAICRLPSEFNLEHRRLLVPRKGVQEILRLLNTIQDERVLVSAGKSHFQLVSSQYTCSTKLIDARFPAYHKAIPSGQDKEVVIDRDILKRALSRIIILANEKSKAILFYVQSGQLTLIANNQEQEEAEESLLAETQGEELKIGMNALYLLDVLNHIHEGLLRISLSNTDSSILVESLEDKNYLYIIMPMKI